MEEALGCKPGGLIPRPPGAIFGFEMAGPTTAQLLESVHTAHRPWPCPRRPWILAMGWHDLAFLHWRVDPGFLAAQLPAPLELDTFHGEAWLGVVPFRMSGVRPRLTPALPGLSRFPEINLRTYVTAEGKPGVWFFSLDVPGRLAVWGARTFFHLPYFRARVSCERSGDEIHYVHERPSGPAFEATYAPSGPVRKSEPGSLDHWLSERYCLYSADGRGRVFRGDVQHVPWPLQPADVEIRRNTFAEHLGLAPFEGAPVAHFAADLQVVGWGLERVGPR